MMLEGSNTHAVWSRMGISRIRHPEHTHRLFQSTALIGDQVAHGWQANTSLATLQGVTTH